jgi:hypothetical protein
MGRYTVEDDRGTGPGSRGLAYRVATPGPPPLQEYPPFAVEAMDFLGAAAIPNALAYALKWQIEFAKLPDPPDERKQELANQLLAIWAFLVRQEVVSPRAPDGALLVDDPFKRMGHPKGPVTYVEVAYNQSIPVAEMEPDPLDPWAPALFPRDLPDDTRRRYPARLKNLDEVPPFFPDLVARWRMASAYRPPPPKPAPVDISDVIRTDPWAFRKVNDDLEQGPTDLKEVKAALEKVERALNRADIAQAQQVAATGPTPTVNRAIGTLAKVTLNDIALQTGVQFDDAWSDQPLLASTEVILYHTVFSFVLDKRGEPFDMNGRLDYPILVPEPGSQMRRSCPPPGGVSVSVQKYGFQNYHIANGKIDKVLFGGVGAFEEYGYGYSGQHDFHKRIQAFIDQGGHTFIAGVTMPAANDREEITIDRITTRLPEFAEAILPPLVNEVRARAKSKVENWQEFVKQIAYEVIKGIIIDVVKTRVRNYIIKKIGARIVPGLNAAAAIYDLATGGTERMRMRHAIACIIVALKSTSDEDMTIAAKVCARIVADAFEDEIMSAIVNAGKKAAGHIAMKVRKGRSGADDGPGEAADEKAGQTKPAAKPGATDATKPDSADAPKDPTSITASKAQSPPAADNLGTDARGRPDHKAPAAAPKAEHDVPNVQAARAVADMKKKIQEDMQRQAQQAVAQSSAQTDAGGQAAGGAPKKPATHSGTADTAASTGARGIDDKANQDTGTANATSGHQQYIRSQQYGPAPDTRARKPRVNTDDPAQTPTADPPPAKKPIRGSGTLDDPHVYPPEPDPVVPTAQPKKDDTPPGDFDQVRDQRHIRTRSLNDVDMQRANRDAVGDPIPPGHQDHHVAPKNSGGDTGESIRDTLRNTGVPVNVPEAALAARGVTRQTVSDSDRAVTTVQDTVADHTKQHGEKKLGPLEKRLGTATGDDDAVRGILSDTSAILGEGRTPEDPDFYLDSQYERGTDDDDKPPKKPPPKKPRGGGAARKKKK